MELLVKVTDEFSVNKVEEGITNIAIIVIVDG